MSEKAMLYYLKKKGEKIGDNSANAVHEATSGGFIGNSAVVLCTYAFSTSSVVSVHVA